MSQRREGRSSAVIVVSSSPQNATQITQQLSRISNSVKIVVANAREFLQRADSLLPRLEQSCIVAANDLDPAALVELISRTHLQHQCPLVLAPGVTLPPSVAPGPTPCHFSIKSATRPHLRHIRPRNSEENTRRTQHDFCTQPRWPTNQ